jgi:hypothetical protein
LWRLLHLFTAAFLVIAVLAPSALAQDDPFFVAPQEETTEMSNHNMKKGQSMMEETTSPEPHALPESGGLPVLLPAATLLLGSALLGYAALRPR